MVYRLKRNSLLQSTRDRQLYCKTCWVITIRVDDGGSMGATVDARKVHNRYEKSTVDDRVGKEAEKSNCVLLDSALVVDANKWKCSPNIDL